MKKSIRSFATAIGMIIAFSAAAQGVSVSTGIKDGTNWSMAQQLTGPHGCGKTGTYRVLEAPEGSPQNIARMAGNQASAGIVQADVLKLKSKDQNLSMLKILFPLHSEQIHILVLREPWLIAKGTLGYGKKERVLNDINDLQGLSVGAGGGSVYTAEVLSQLSNVQFDLQTEIGDTKALINAVGTKQITAAVFVGGQPMKAIAALGKEFKLLPLSPELRAAGQKYAYRNQTLAYDNLGTQGVPTLEVDALFMVYDFSSKKMQDQLLALRKCFYENVAEISETENMHAAWRSVPKDPTFKPAIKWDYYQPGK